MTSEPIAETLTPAALETMWCMFAMGPTWDGDVPSKSGRDQLVRLGLAERYEGYQWLTREGVEAAVDAEFGLRKEKWLRTARRLP